MKSIQMFKTLALFAATALFGLGVQAQGVYPDKSIRLVVPYNAGGGTDVLARAIAMGAGMLPIAIGLGTDPSFRAPMAIVVIGGLITSTFLSLLVIPVVFTYVDDLIQRLFKRKKTGR